MSDLSKLEEELVELKLKKRSFILANKDTTELDEFIDNIEDKINSINEIKQVL